MSEPDPIAPPIPLETDEAVIGRFVAKREARDFDILLSRYQGLAYRFSMSIANNRTIAEEAVQEAFMNLTRTELNFVDLGPGSFRGWFCQSIANITRSCIRKETRISMRSKKLESESKSRRLARENPTSQRDLQDTVVHALSEVDEEYRVPVIMHVVEGLSQAEIAQLVGVSQPQISRRITEGLELLRGRLSRLGITGAAAIVPIMQSQGFMELSPQLADRLGKLSLHLEETATRPPLPLKPVTQSGFMKTAVIVTGLTLGILALAYSMYSSTPVRSIKASAVPAPVVPELKPYRQSWDFNTADAPAGMRIISGTWRHLDKNGRDDSGCMEMTSKQIELELNKPSIHPYYAFSFSYSVQTSDNMKMGLRIPNMFEFTEYGLLRTLVLDLPRNQPPTFVWRRCTFYFSETFLICIDDDGLTSFHSYRKHNISGPFYLALDTQVGGIRIDNMEIRSVQKEEIPDVTPYMKAVELIPVNQRKDRMLVPIKDDPMHSKGPYYLNMFKERLK